jgi:type I restriction enzyme M protein
MLNSQGHPGRRARADGLPGRGRALPARRGPLLGTCSKLTEGANLGKAIATAMALVEEHNPELKGVLPRGYNLLPNATLVELLRLLAPLDLEGDAFGKVYEYFLGNFALKEGQKGGVFYTPTSIVRLIVEILQPFHGRIFDPACGSGGMFVQSRRLRAAPPEERHPRAHRVRHREGQRHRQARQDEPRGARPVGRHPRGQHLLRRPAQGPGRFDFVMANPPFNVSGVDKDRLKDDRRFPSACPPPTTPTTCGSSSSRPASTRTAAPAS